MKLILNSEKVEEQRAKINAIRNAKEVSTIEVTISAGTFQADCDSTSVDRMSNAVLLWDGLGIADIVWTMGDNEKASFTKAELEEFKAAVVTGRAGRSLQLHDYASDLKATLPAPDDSIIFNGDNWEV